MKLKLKHLVVPLLLALPIPTAAALAGNGDQRSAAAEAAAATAGFHDVAAAEAAGYGLLRDAAGIASNPGVGTMGIHYVNGTFVGDTVLDAQRPEALVYEPEANGKLKLVALEYIVFQAAWDATHTEPPSLFGRRFDFTPSPNRYGIPAFYALHAWIWKPNPTGLLEPWNPSAAC
jgi:hypothetical protein